MKILKFIDFIKEGVGDKYAEKRFFIPDEFAEFNREFKKEKILKEKEDIIGHIKNVPIIKNPKNINNFEEGVRGVITSNGNLYLASTSGDIIHVDILEYLKNKGIIREKETGWEDLDERKPGDFITIQRVWNKKIIAIGESYIIPKKSPLKEEYLEIFTPFLEKAKQKNPKLEFINMQVRSASRKYLSGEELSNYKIRGS